MNEIVLVSACLAGLKTRYDAQASPHERVIELLREGKALPVCPEQLGGLPTPRDKAEIESGSGEEVLNGLSRVLNDKGEDITDKFVRGATETLKLVEMMGIKKAIMKERSPSCGVNSIIRGGREVQGRGVTTALLQDRGIEVISSDTL